MKRRTKGAALSGASPSPQVLAMNSTEDAAREVGRRQRAQRGDAQRQRGAVQRLRGLPRELFGGAGLARVHDQQRARLRVTRERPPARPRPRPCGVR